MQLQPGWYHQECLPHAWILGWEELTKEATETKEVYITYVAMKQLVFALKAVSSEGHSSLFHL